MKSIIVNKTSVDLVEQDRATFQRFAEMSFSQCLNLIKIPRERRYISMLPASYVLRRREEGDAWDEPMMQVALWNLHDLGVEEMSISMGSSDGGGESEPQIRFDRAEATDMALGRESAINFSTVRSGRGLIAALNNVIHRTFHLNGVEFEVGIQDREQVEKYAKMAHEIRQPQEGLLFAIARVFASMLKQGLTAEDVEVRAGMELLTNLGCTAISVPTDEDRVVFNGFSVMAGLSSGLLQGLEWEQLKEIRKNVQLMIDQIEARAETPVVQGMSNPVAKRRRRK
ncbi:MAG: hypothetical protein CMJ52_01835 [Planctomycetaceae bacterium]|nr:hypothetical protein [Planctomycetaceae bacterium]